MNLDTFIPISIWSKSMRPYFFRDISCWFGWGFYFLFLVLAHVFHRGQQKTTIKMCDDDTVQFHIKIKQNRNGMKNRHEKAFLGNLNVWSFFLIFQSKLMSCLQMNSQKLMMGTLTFRKVKKQHRRKNNFGYVCGVRFFLLLGKPKI